MACRSARRVEFRAARGYGVFGLSGRNDSNQWKRELGVRLRMARERHQWSLTEAERRTGMNFSTLGRYERGERSPNLETLRELSQAYGVTLGELLGDPGGVINYLPADLRSSVEVLLHRPELRDLVTTSALLSPEAVHALCSFLEQVSVDQADGS